MISGLMRDLMIVNPARAGMILGHVTLTAKIKSKPRASGDDPVLSCEDSSFVV